LYHLDSYLEELKKAVNISFRTVGRNLTTITHSAKDGQDRIKSSPITGYSHLRGFKPGSRNVIGVETVFGAAALWKQDALPTFGRACCLYL
jgi:hypothetical protein